MLKKESPETRSMKIVGDGSIVSDASTTQVVQANAGSSIRNVTQIGSGSIAEGTPALRAKLRQVLVNRFSLDELKTLAFDLGIDYNLFYSDTTSADFSRELIAYCERRNFLDRLIREVLRQRNDEELAQMLAQLPSTPPTKKVQIIISTDKMEDASQLIKELAKQLNLSENEITIVSAAIG